MTVGGEGGAATIRGEIVDFGACAVRVAGRLHARDLDDLREEILRLVRLGCRQVIVDLSGASVEPLAPALLELTRAVRNKRGDLALVSNDDDLARALGRYGVPVVQTPGEAAARFSLAGG